MKNSTQKGNVAIILLVIVVLIAGGWYLYKNRTGQLSGTSTTVTMDDSDTDGELASWNSYTYKNTVSKILPDITLKYPASFGSEPYMVSSQVINTPEFFDSNWGGMFIFSSTKSVGNGVSFVFKKLESTSISFEDFVNEFSTGHKLSSPKYFETEDYRVARVRLVSASEYDGDLAFYFVELPNNKILQIETGGNSGLLFDEDSGELSTRDKIISTIRFNSTNF